MINYSKLNPKNWRQPSFKKIIRIIAIIIIFLSALIVIKNEYYQFDNNDCPNKGENIEKEISEKTCNTMVVKLYGDMVTYISPKNKDENGNHLNNETASEDVVSAIETANKDKTIKAIILEVDSYGGSAIGAEEIANTLKRAAKPTVALVRSGATSAAYWASTGANIIFASNLSDIGSIGVTMSYLDASKQNINNGLTYNSLSVGKFKDYGDSNKPLTSEEKKLIMRDLNIIYENFIKTVAKNRNLDINKVKKLADGSSMPGQMALDNGLIDRIGGMNEVKEYLKNKTGEDTEICW